jgi:hypothetical protein
MCEVAEAQAEQAKACRRRPDQVPAALIHRVLHVRAPFIHPDFLVRVVRSVTGHRLNTSMCKE